jgi:hypothetical protein
MCLIRGCQKLQRKSFDLLDCGELNLLIPEAMAGSVTGELRQRSMVAGS